MLVGMGAAHCGQVFMVHHGVKRTHQFVSQNSDALLMLLFLNQRLIGLSGNIVKTWR